MLVYSMIVSADGFITDRDGGVGFSPPSDEQFRFSLEQIRGLGAYLIGRRLYETMLVWETDPALQERPDGPAFAEAWRALPKVVFSRTGAAVRGNARLATRPLTEEIAAVRDGPTEDVAIGGAMLASAAIELDLVDEYRMLTVPYATGGGTRYWPPLATGRALELVESRTIGPHAVHEAYRRSRG